MRYGENSHGVHKCNMGSLAKVEIIQFCNYIFMQRAGFKEVDQFLIE